MEMFAQNMATGIDEWIKLDCIYLLSIRLKMKKKTVHISHKKLVVVHTAHRKKNKIWHCVIKKIADILSGQTNQNLFLQKLILVNKQYYLMFSYGVYDGFISHCGRKERTGVSYILTYGKRCRPAVKYENRSPKTWTLFLNSALKCWDERKQTIKHLCCHY